MQTASRLQPPSRPLPFVPPSLSLAPPPPLTTAFSRLRVANSEEEHINGRDQARRVTFKLPEGAVSERTTSVRRFAVSLAVTLCICAQQPSKPPTPPPPPSASQRRNSARKRSHLSHRDILTLYRQACMAGDLEAIDSVVAQLERAARGDRDASQRLCIEGTSRTRQGRQPNSTTFPPRSRAVCVADGAAFPRFRLLPPLPHARPCFHPPTHTHLFPAATAQASHR